MHVVAMHVVHGVAFRMPAGLWYVQYGATVYVAAGRPFTSSVVTVEACAKDRLLTPAIP